MDLEKNIDQNIEDNKNDKIVRLLKNININKEVSNYIDNTFIQHRIYNSFNYFFLSRENKEINFTLGVTSAKSGEGKTLIASNLAVSLALSSKKNTLLIDLNIANPRLNKIFGTPISPGLTEALNESEINVFQSSIDYLHIIPAGKKLLIHEKFFQSKVSNTGKQQKLEPSLGLEHLASFRDIIYTLEQKYEFIIVDMPAIGSNTIPPLFANQFHGLIIVVRSEHTKKEDIDSIFHKVGERNVIGFVINNFKKI